MIEAYTNKMNPSLCSSSSLSGKELKTVIGELGAYSQIHRNATGYVTGYGGILFEELSWLSLRLNFSLEMVPSKDNLLGENKNGTWNGMTGQLQRKEVDFACAPFAGYYTHAILELAAYIVGDAFGIFVKYPKPIIALDGPINIFSLDVWVGILFSMIVCIGCIQLLTYLANKHLAQTQFYKDFTMSNTWLYVFGTLTNHSVNNYPHKGHRSVGVVAFIWLLSTFVFVNIYSSCMASYMSLKFQRPDISTFEDMASNQNYRPATMKGTGPEFTFLKMQSGTFGRIGAKFRQCPDGRYCSFSSFEKIIKGVLEENFVAVLPVTVGHYYIKKTVSNQQCLLTMGQETMAFVNMFMGVPKNSPYAMDINKESFWWNALGFQRYWMNKLMPIPHQCLLQYNKNGESVQFLERVQFKLEQFRVAFLVLFIGYTLALIQFLRERFIYKQHRQ